MSAAANWPVAVVPVGNVACASRLWRTKGRLHVTVIVKASFDLAPDGPMAQRVAEPVRPEAGEAAPYLTQTDIVVTAGHAYTASAQPVAALSVRLAAIRDWPVIDKKLLVYPRASPDAAASPVRVQRLSLGADGPEAGTLVNPAEPAKQAGLAPLGAGSEERLATLGGQGVPRMVGQVVEIDDLFPWSYFQVAPPDQRTTHLRGDEWLVLEGMHPDRPRWTSRLPAAMAQVVVYPPGLAGGASYFVEMVGDQIFIDAQQGRASLLWRGSFPVESEAAATSMTMVAGVALPGRPVAWPTREQLLASPVLRAYGLVPQGEDEDSLAQTLVVGQKFDVADLQAMAQQGGSPATTKSKHTQLALTAEGILALTEEVIELDLEPDDEIDDAQTVALSADQSEALKSALGLPTARKQMLRPARLVGLPWMSVEDEPTTTSEEPTTSDDDAPELEAYTIDSLELTLSESLIAQGISREELEALIAMGGKMKSPGDGSSK